MRQTTLTIFLLSPLALADSAIDDLLAHPAAAREFDYCAWRFAGGDELPDFERLLDELEDPRLLRAAVLAEAGTTVARAADSPRACEKAFAAGFKRHEKLLARARKQRDGKPDRSDAPEIAEVQRTLHELWLRDQAARDAYVASKTERRDGAEYWAARLAVAEARAADAASTATMRELVERWDWIDIHRFGSKTSNHAWLLVQHADRHPDFQAEVLARMEPYLADGGVTKRNYAYLWDRVAVNHDREQRYGTQPDWNCKDGELELKPVEDPDGLAARRAEMGLGPVEQALAEMSAHACGG